MNTIYVLTGIAVGLVTLIGVFIKLAFQMGSMNEQLKNIVKVMEEVTAEVKELFEWRYQSAIRSKERRGRLPGNKQEHGRGES